MGAIELVIYGLLCAVIGFIGGYKFKEVKDEGSD